MLSEEVQYEGYETRKGKWCHLNTKISGICYLLNEDEQLYICAGLETNQGL